MSLYFVLAVALLVLAVGGCRAPHRACQVVCGRKGHRRGIDAAGRSTRDFLDDPRVAVGIFESDLGAVALALGVRAADASCQGKRRAVEYFTRLDAPGDELLVRGFDVGDDQPAAKRTRLGGRDPLAE